MFVFLRVPRTSCQHQMFFVCFLTICDRVDLTYVFSLRFPTLGAQIYLNERFALGFHMLLVKHTGFPVVSCAASLKFTYTICFPQACLHLLWSKHSLRCQMACVQIDVKCKCSLGVPIIAVKICVPWPWYYHHYMFVLLPNCAQHACFLRSFILWEPFSYLQIDRHIICVFLWACYNLLLKVLCVCVCFHGFLTCVGFA